LFFSVNSGVGDFEDSDEQCLVQHENGTISQDNEIGYNLFFVIYHPHSYGHKLGLYSF